MKLEAIVLAGGFGTRLQSVVSGLPKPMAPIGGRPFLEILLKGLSEKGFGRVILSLGFMADKIIGHFGSNFCGMELQYVVENEPLGTGGAIRLGMSEAKQDHIYIFNGDTYLDLEVDAVERQWQRFHYPIIVGKEVDDATRYGCLLSECGRVTGFSEKTASGSGLINAGCYVLGRNELNSFLINTAFSLEMDYLSLAVKNTRFDLFITSGHFIDIGVPEDYSRAQSELK